MCVGMGCIGYPNVSNVCRYNMWQQDYLCLHVSMTCMHIYVHQRPILLHKTSLSCMFACVVSLDVSQTANLSQCSSSALRTSHRSPTVTRWPTVGVCQGLCGLHQAVQRFPFPGALGAPVWPQRTVFMSCVIADLSLSRRPVSVKIVVCSLQARPKSHQLPAVRPRFPQPPA